MVATTDPSLRDAVLRGSVWATLLVFPLAALCALIYRFPIPFGGYLNGPAAVPMALMAVIFYGLLGGFPALLAAGGIGGAVSYIVGRPDPQRIRQLTITAAAIVAFVSVVVLAVLDKLIGPW